MEDEDRRGRDVEWRATRLAGAVWGQLVGDAIGVPYEFRAPEAVGGVRLGEAGTHGVPSGTWSDDGALMLALLDSLLGSWPEDAPEAPAPRFDPEDQGRRARAWFRHGAYTPDGVVFDVGGTTGRALRAMEAGTPAADAGPRDEGSQGNGSLMRILPVALVFAGEPPARLVQMADLASRVTHGHPVARATCALHVLVARELLRGERSRPRALARGRAELGRAVAGSELESAIAVVDGWTERTGRGYVVDAFWSAWDAFAGARDYRGAIERAIRYGHDTDTTAAIAGGLAGLYWGIDGIPPEWLAGLRGRDVALPIVDRLLATDGWRTSTTNPLRVDWVDLAGVPALAGTSGRLGMTLLPGKQRDGWTGLHWRDLATDARRLRERWGTDTFLLLVQDRDLDIARAGDVVAGLAAAGIEVLRHPVPDMDVPEDPAAFRATLDGILDRLRAGQAVVVACRGGLGRTGTAVACLLVDGGLDPEAAIRLTRASRRGTIERDRQEAFVRSWASVARAPAPDGRGRGPGSSAGRPATRR